MDFKKEIIKELKKLVKVDISLTIPKNAEHGDFAFPCFNIGKNPVEEAKKLEKKFKSKYITKVQAVGPFLNFFVNNNIVVENTLKEINKKQELYGIQKLSNEKIVIEFPSPNTNKPLHLGHVRNMVLGTGVSNLLKAIGNKIYHVNLVNDKGVHICKSMLAYQKYGKNKKPDIKTDHFVGQYYVKFDEEVKKNAQLETEAQDMLNAWEQGDKEVVKLWKKMRNWALKGMDETYAKFNLDFNKVYFESEIYYKGREVVKKALKKGLLYEKEGAVFAPLKDLQDKVLLRSDGTTVYMTQDLYLAEQKIKDFKASSSIYVVASEQNFHFKQLFSILELLGNSWAKKCYHLSYGMVLLPDGKMKSREGTVVDADNLIDEVVTLASDEIKKRHHLGKKLLDERSRQVAMGAIRFYLLKNDPIKDMVYNPKESISFEGETGPYVQYAHARCCAILRKAKEHNLSVVNTVNHSLFGVAEEIKLLKLLYEFPSVVGKSANDYKTHHIANYLISLAQAFNEFYHKCPVISEVRDQTKARLLLVDSVRQVLENGLGLLGIGAPKVM